MKEDIPTFELICFVQEGKQAMKKISFGAMVKVETGKNITAIKISGKFYLCLSLSKALWVPRHDKDR